MHQSGQERAHNMQTVQFSSLSAMTPRARGAGSSRSCGYCTVTAGFIIVRNVTPRPVSMPLISRFIVLPRNRPATEEKGGRERGERERGTELADEKEQEAKACVLDHVAGHELRFRDRHVERRLGELGLRGHHEQREAGELRENQGKAD